jgi:hypothetical protein
VTDVTVAEPVQFKVPGSGIEVHPGFWRRDKQVARSLGRVVWANLPRKVLNCRLSCFAHRDSSVGENG